MVLPRRAAVPAALALFLASASRATPNHGGGMPSGANPIAPSDIGTDIQSVQDPNASTSWVPMQTSPQPTIPLPNPAPQPATVPAPSAAAPAPAPAPAPATSGGSASTSGSGLSRIQTGTPSGATDTGGTASAAPSPVLKAAVSGGAPAPSPSGPAASSPAGPAALAPVGPGGAATPTAAATEAATQAQPGIQVLNQLSGMFNQVLSGHGYAPAGSGAAAAAPSSGRSGAADAPGAGAGAPPSGMGRTFGGVDAGPLAAGARQGDVGPLDRMAGDISSLPESRSSQRRRSDALVQQALLELKLGKSPRRALELLNEAVRLDPDNLTALVRRAEVENKLKRYDDALADAKEAIRRDPKDAAAWDQAAWAHFRSGRFQDAIAAATRALFLNPNDAFALAIRARAKWAAGDKDGALADARAAARLDARFAALAEAMAQGGFSDDGGELLADDAAQVPLERSMPWLLLLGMAALLLAALGGLTAWLTRKGSRRPKLRTFSSLARPTNGRLAGKYELKSVIGKGGMGTVHEAYDHSLKRLVAVKKMAEDLSRENPQARELLVREAQTVAGLSHPNIVDIYEIVEEGRDLYLVFELVRGVTLSQRITERGPLPLETAVSILKPVCQALQFAHQRELVHRDLKPGNIMLADDGTVKLMDFGIARATGAAPRPADATPPGTKDLPLLARTQMVMGTPLYMAPEMDYGVVSKAGDVYALGVCLYEMLTCRHPFETSADKLELRWTPPSQFVPGLSRRVDELLEKTLQPDPAKRTRTPMVFFGSLFAAAQPDRTPGSPLPAR